MSPQIKHKVKLELNENHEKCEKTRKVEKVAKVVKMACISVISIRQRLRKCGFKTFKGGTTRKVAKMMKNVKIMKISLFLHKMLMKLRARAHLVV